LLNLATETDIERLRQAALLLEQENAWLLRCPERPVADLAGVEPRTYFGEAARRTMQNPGTVPLARDLKQAELHRC